MDLKSEKLGNLSESIFRAVSRGSVSTLEALLVNIDKATTEMLLHWRKPWLEDTVLHTPLTLGIRNNCHNVVEYLLKHYNLDVNQTQGIPSDPSSRSLWTNEPALWYAVLCNNLSLVRNLIEHHKADRAGIPRGSVSLLSLACCLGHMDIMQYLLQLEESNPTMSKKGEENCFVYAIINNHVDVVESLLKSGQSAEYCDLYGQSLLHVAAYYGHDKITEVLLKHRAPVAMVDAFQLTPIQLAAHRGHETTFNILYAHLEKKGQMTRTESISLLELMGASKGIESFRKHHMASCYGYLTKAMRERNDAENGVIKKEALAPQDRYDYKLEHTTMEDLHRLRGVRFNDVIDDEQENPDYTVHPLIRESFIIKERLLGPESLHMAYSLLQGTELYKTSLQNQQLLCFMQRILYILSLHHTDMDDLLSLLIHLVKIQAQLKIYNTDDNSDSAFCQLKSLVKKIGEFSESQHFWAGYFQLQNHCSDRGNTSYNILECILSSIFYTRKHLPKKASAWKEFRTLLGQCIKLCTPGIVNSHYSTTLLHVLYRYQWPKRLYNGDIYVPLTRLLLDCGANPEMEDIHGKTPTDYVHEARDISMEDKARCVQIFVDGGAKHGVSQAIKTLSLW